MSDLEKLFIDLVTIDSPSGEEREMSQYLLKWLHEVGFKTTIDDTGNIYAFTEKEPKLFICSHMDTVEPGRNIKPILKDGIFVSDGTTILGADNKAAVAAIISAVNSYKDINGQPPSIEIVFSVREETGGGIEFFPFKWLKSKRGYIFDSAKPLGHIILAAPYIYNFHAKFIGKPSHSSRPEEGCNSLLPAIKFISNVKVGRFDNGETTINIGKVHSGSGINIIPEETIVDGEVRSTNHKKFLSHLEEIESLAKKTIEGSNVEIKYHTDGYCPGYKWDKDSELIKSIVHILKNEVSEITYDQSTGVSDANSFNGFGFEVVNLSDGVSDPHTKKESIKSEDLKKLSEIILHILKDFS